MMHETVRDQYPLVSMIDNLNRLENVKPFETESLLDYVTRFKRNCNIIIIHLGKGILSYFIEKVNLAPMKIRPCLKILERICFLDVAVLSHHQS